ncbi:MAG: hypothetical protein MK086_02090 [Flavobacteriales bacterium]|nr:hypothetical protein [Flavobacteriales bacterium]
MKTLKKFSWMFSALLVAMLLSTSTFAQEDDKYGEDMKEILFMVIDGNYEKAVGKAEKYMEKEDTRRDPRPYMYASMAYFEISKNDEMAEDYPRAFRDAIKYGGKARRYDKENKYMPEFDRYLAELKAEVMQEAKYHFDTENWRKSATFAKNVQRLDPNDLSAILLKATAEWRGKNVYQAETTIGEAKTALENFTASSVSSEGKPAYRFALMEFAELMKEEGRKVDAAPFLDAVEPVLGGDKEFDNFMASY